MSLHFFQADGFTGLVNRYKSHGYVTISAYFNQAKNIYDVFDEIKASLPLDPPLYSLCNFDAFSDSLFGGLDSLGEHKICVFLVDLKNALKNDDENYSVILDILSDNVSYLKTEGRQVFFFIS
ncbi:barstar family protein [Pectobacterium parmentieri]|uniref:Barstar family protein n=1 Tax=Pectobacterium parmentieri TaxID=1905730 RepID=A0A0H3HZ50_PECPM|nr:barstar family protein [Pectobacterium parmentieri]ACX86914.1 conserved hypothetical protein [Pectobacterium parmentieri WPP163]AFI89111.1 Hypothetical protein W5S_0993 [Pectobacterium parmentieri]AOR59889.1 hypothetical protein A8F97_13445 [Pectobacterium parmentieri]AYH04845.1 hypothetical protein C5E25_05400 [Pectobacterium parmentieri]AYH09122.1 hypothetical protein C5E24_05075 [Pectobacterium parmentieri]